MASYSRRNRNPSDMFPGNFPEGLRVLVVDDDLSSLVIMEGQLLGFNYQVTKCHEEEEALSLLRSKPENRFEIVIINFRYIFKILPQVGSKINLPIVVISSEDSVESVVEAMSRGACDFLTKPVNPETLRMIYKYVVKTMVDNAGTGNSHKRVWSGRDGEEDNNPNQNKNDNDHNASASAAKKNRVVWSAELRRQFVDAVNHLGLENAVPKKILEIMNVPYLTRENVASHLQKYRMHLKKEEEEQDQIRISNINAQQKSRELYFENNKSNPNQNHNQSQTRNQNQSQNQNHNRHVCANWQSQTHNQSQNQNHMQLVRPSMGHSLVPNGVPVPISGRNDVMDGQRDSNFVSDLGIKDDEISGLVLNENFDVSDDLFEGKLAEYWNLEDIGLSPIFQDLSPLQRENDVVARDGK